MEIKTLRKSSCVVISFLVIIISSTATYANDYFGILQVTEPSSGLKRIVIQRSDSKRFCEILNEEFWSGVKTTCPNCIKDFSIISESIPHSYRGIYKNKPIIFPYLSSKEDRIIFFGIPMKDAIKLCKTLAEAYKIKLNRPAKAIIPLNIND